MFPVFTLNGIRLPVPAITSAKIASEIPQLSAMRRVAPPATGTTTGSMVSTLCA
jgi:hypothetical protein